MSNQYKAPNGNIGLYDRQTNGSPLSSPERMHSLDALRAIALLAVVFAHTAMSFAVKCPPGWAACDSSKSFLFDFFIFAIVGFAMQIFFLLAGYFSVSLIFKKGLTEYVRNRMKRIVVPFILSLIIIVPIMQIVGLYGSSRKITTNVAELGFRTSVVNFFTSSKYFKFFTLGHLWFLWYLILLYILLVIIIIFVRHIPKLAYINKWFAALLKSPVKPLLFAIPTIGFMLPMNFIIDTPLSIFPEFHILAFYAFFFCVGIMLVRQPQFFSMRKNYWGFYLISAFFIFLPATLLIIMKASVAAEMKASNYYVAAITCFATYIWLMIFGLIGLFGRYASRPIAVILYLSEASFWVYLIHFPIVLLLQILVKDWKQPAILKFIILSCLLTIILLGSYELFVRRTFIGKILNGKRTFPDLIIPVKHIEQE